MTAVAVPRPTRRDRAAAGVVLTLLVLLGLVLPTGPAWSADPRTAADVSTAPSATSDLPVEVRLTSLSPTVTRPGEDLTVVVEVENVSGADIASPVVDVLLARSTYVTRTALARWAESGPDGPAGTTVHSVPLDAPLAAGATTTVTLVVPASALQLRAGLSSWGPRGLAVTVHGDTDDLSAWDRLGIMRTYIVWFPVEDSAVVPLDVSVLVPVVGPAYDPLAPERSLPQLQKLTTDDGRLAAVLESTADSTGVSWAVDPALVAAAQRTAPGAVTPTDDPDAPATPPATPGADDAPAAPADATAPADDEPPPPADPDDPAQQPTRWAERLLGAATSREVYALPRYDQDWAAYAAADVMPPADPPLTDDLASWRTDLAWPADAGPDEDVIELAATTGKDTVILNPDSLLPDPALTYTPSGYASATTGSGTVHTLVPDGALSAQLEDPADTAPAARQRLVAELAVISRERPADARHLLLTAPRDWAPDADVARTQLAGLSEVPWATLAPVADLATSEQPEVPRAALPGDPSSERALSRAAFDQLAAVRDELASFARIAADPGAVVAPVDDAIAATASVAWRSDRAGRSAAIARINDHAAAVSSSISIVGASDFTLISSASTLFRTVRNDLDQAVTLVVHLEPDDPRLVTEESIPVTIEPRSEVQVDIPVKAVGSGNVNVVVEILAVDGTVVAQPSSFDVRVRADWENRGTAVVAGLLVLLLLGGIWRTIHRGRSDRRASAAVVDQLEHIEQTGELDVLIDHGGAFEAPDDTAHHPTDAAPGTSGRHRPPTENT